jgi:hypothetical protein
LIKNQTADFLIYLFFIFAQIVRGEDHGKHEGTEEQNCNCIWASGIRFEKAVDGISD